MKVLVTGGAGFIGRNIVQQLQNNAQVTVIDNFRSSTKHNLDGLNCSLVVGSILDREVLREAMRNIDYVFHLAALTSVPESVAKPLECAEINTTGTHLILEEATRAKVKKLVFSSSAAIYGDNPSIPKTEATSPEPKSPYAVTKLEGERLCQKFTDAGRLQTVCLRYFNVFGPHQNPKSQYAAAVPIFIDQALGNQPLVIFGDGNQTRDFIYVDDVVAANIFLATQSDATDVFNVGCGECIAIRDLARRICRLTNSSSTINYAAERPADVKHSVAAIDKILGAGFTPKCDINKGLERTIAFFRNKTKAVPH